MRPKTLLAQLYSVYILTIFISFLILTIISITSIRSQSIQNITSELTDQAVIWRSISSNSALASSLTALDKNLKEITSSSKTRVTVVNKQGNVVADSDYDVTIMENHNKRPEVQEAMLGKIGVATRYSRTLNQDMLYVAIPYYNDGGDIIGVVRTAKAITSIKEEMGNTLERVGLFSIFILIITAIITWFTANRITKQLSLLTKAAEAFSKRDFTHPLPDKKTTEIAQLSNTIVKMATDLNEGIITTERQKKELEAMLSSMVEAVIVIDNQLRIKSVNPAASQIFRIEETKVKGLSLLEVFHSTELHKLAMTTDHTSFQEKDITLTGPPEQYFRVHSTLLTGENNQKVGILMVMNNITRMKRLERMRQDFVANVSHELRTPITSIMGFVETLRNGALSQPQHAEHFLSIIDKQSHRLASIIDDLLSLSGIEQVEGGEIERHNFNLTTTLQSCVQTQQQICEKKNIGIKIDCSDRLIINANSLLIEQAIQNLVSNAVKYSPEKSLIQIQAEQNKTSTIIRVIDNGPGIPEQYLERIFERFFRVDKARSREVGGTGLGLAIVKHIAMVHGGTVEVESDEGSGSTFTLTIPR
ncbi:sensor histidine kinase [Spirochaeta cellobiosiphila]|uniref:sensor histidine kinase n=1 Tax=Spirochaeta cellobiosiphila TaxID=504483 RepID=UPI0004030A41|nr:ATP-binding protein [Spirochaeta cellobiosiphila]